MRDSRRYSRYSGKDTGAVMFVNYAPEVLEYAPESIHFLDQSKLFVLACKSI